MKFGTDGFRGPVETDITPEFCLKLAHHTGKIILEEGYDSVIIGKDTRVSGYMLESALQAGFISSGVNVKLAGPIPTPAVSFLTATYQGQFGVVLSASHNPYFDNGIKFFNRFGRKISEDLEKRIESKFNDKIDPESPEKLGKAFRIDSASGRYIEYCKSTLRGKSDLKGKTILVDAANGANYKITPMLLEELGAKVIRVNCVPDGKNINEKCAVLDQNLFQDYASKYDFDYCAAIDGDGDRLVLSDHKGNIFSGDEILFLLALKNIREGAKGSNKVVGTEMTNSGIGEALKKFDIELLRADVGDKHISRMLVEEDLVLGAESSGHIIQRQYSESGDANIALIQTIAELNESKNTLQKIRSQINYRPSLLKSFPVKNFLVLKNQDFQNCLNGIKAKNDDIRLSVRRSGTERKIRIRIEGDDDNNINKIMHKLENFLV